MFFYSETQDVVVPSLLSLTVNSSNLSFSNTCVGDNSQNSFTVTATGNATETVTISDNTDQYSFSPSTFSLSGGGSQIVNVTFAPTSWGVKTGSINVVSSGGSTKTVSLSAVCIANPLIITSSLGQINFGSGYVNETSSATFIVSAGGRVQDIVLLADDSDQFDFSPTSFSMTGANQTQTVTVYFTPTSNGSKLGVLTLSASGGDVAHVSLTGSAIYRPLVLTSSVNSLDLGTGYISETSSVTFTVSAGGIGGTETVTLSDNSDQFDFSPASFSLTGGGSSQTVTASFTPSSSGTKNATLTLNSSGGSTKNIALTGSGIYRELVLTSSIDNIFFSNTVVNTISSSTFTVSAGGVGGTETITLSDDSNQFDYSPSTFTLTGGGSSKTVTASFTPSTIGVKTGNLTISSSGGSSKSIYMQGTGLEQYYYSSSLILKGELVSVPFGSGINQNTYFVDNSQYNATITSYGNTVISSTKSKYGNTSIYFDGNGDYLTAPNNSGLVFGSSNFTIEMWINPAGGLANGTQKYLFGKRTSISAYVSVMSLLTYSSTAGKYSLSLYASFNGTSWGVGLNTTSSISPNVWTHIACVRNGNVWTVYINGVSYGTTTIAGTVNDTGTAFSVGSVSTTTPSTNGFAGYIDDFRVTKGVARYTANFTPPGEV